MKPRMPRTIEWAAPAGLFLPAVTFLFLYAQSTFDPVEDVPLRVAVAPTALTPADSGVLSVTLHLPSNVHITSRDLGFFFLSGDTASPVDWGESRYPDPVEHEGEWGYRGEVVLELPFRVRPSTAPGTRMLSAGLGYQICTETPPIYCTPPVERQIQVPIEIQAAMPGTGAAPLSGSTSLENRARLALESGSWWALLWVFIGGVLLSFTPCVYPVIPITVAYIGARSGGSRWRGFNLSLVFVLGLALTYSALGVVAAATGSVFGFSTQNPWVMGFVALVFVVMGAGMLGAFTLSLPSSLQTRLSSHGRRGYVGALLVGATTGLVAAPCVGPVLVALLGWLSSTGNLLAGFVYLFVFALGLGALFVVIGTFSGVLASLPKAGVWMDYLKHAFGVVLVAVGFYFGRGVIPKGWFQLLLGAGLVMGAGAMGVFIRPEPGAPAGRRIVHAVSTLVLAIGLLYFVIGFSAVNRLTLFSSASSGVYSATPASVIAVAEPSVEWIWNQEDVALKRARNVRRPVLIDFWADWCPACKELDRKTFSDPRVFQLINAQTVPLKMDGSEVTPDVKRNWARYSVIGLPTVLLLHPETGRELMRVEAFRPPDEFLPLLKAALADLKP